MKTKVVVLDWDGVLYDSAEIYVGHFNTVLGHYGKEPVTLQKFRERVVAADSGEFFMLAGISEVEQAKQKFLKLTRGEPRPTVFADTHDMLRWLNHRLIETHIVSAHPTEDICRILSRYDLARFVTSVRGDTSPEGKIAFLTGIIATKGIAPDELIFVDDVDVALEAARSAGCYRVASARGYCSHERLLEARPDKIIRNFKNLQGYINFIHYSHQPVLPAAGTPRKASRK